MVALAGCSFIGVRGPSGRVGLVPDDPDKIKCTESSLLPSLDALGGALAIAGAGGGIISEQVGEEGKPENFTKYYAGPLIALAIVYFASASFGNTRVTWCTDIKERSLKARDSVRPVEFEDGPAPKKKPKPIEDPEEPDIEIHK